MLHYLYGFQLLIPEAAERNSLGADQRQEATTIAIRAHCRISVQKFLGGRFSPTSCHNNPPQDFSAPKSCNVYGFDFFTVQPRTKSVATAIFLPRLLPVVQPGPGDNL